MSRLGLAFNNRTRDADLTGDGDPLYTSAFINLFTRAQVAETDGVVLPAVRQGWWANQYLKRPIGSRLWTLRNGKLNDETLALVQLYAYEALAWWIPRIAKGLVTSAERTDTTSFRLRVEATKPDGGPWSAQWERTLDGL